CNDYTIFCKNTLHKSYNSTSYSNITIERTLHKIIITHITFYIYKKILFQAIQAHDAYNRYTTTVQTPRVSQISNPRNDKLRLVVWSDSAGPAKEQRYEGR